MSTLKKFLLLVLAFVSIFVLAGCQDKEARNLLDELESLIDGLQEQLGNANASIDELREQLEEAQENSDKVVKRLLSDLTAAGAIQPTSLSATLKNETTVLGVPNQEGFYSINTGEVIDLEFVITAKYDLNGVEYEFEVENAWYQVDYFLVRYSRLQ